MTLNFATPLYGISIFFCNISKSKKISLVYICMKYLGTCRMNCYYLSKNVQHNLCTTQVSTKTLILLFYFNITEAWLLSKSCEFNNEPSMIGNGCEDISLCSATWIIQDTQHGLLVETKSKSEGTNNIVRDPRDPGSWHSCKPCATDTDILEILETGV